MADSQTEQDAMQQEDTQDPSNDKSDAPPVADGEEDAIHTARSELRKTMEEVAENPPSEQPPPASVVTQEIVFEKPVPDPYDKAISYLEKHNILQLFQTMTANIVFHKPDNPLDFMISEVAELKKRHESKKPASKNQQDMQADE